MKPLKPMTSIEKAYWALKDLEKKLKLITDEVAAQIPARTTSKPKGYIIDPETGKKIHYK